MTKSDTKFDSLLFDMDGTLWDAVASYCAVWNATIDTLCPGVPHVTYEALSAMMGKPIEDIFAAFIGDAAPFDAFMKGLLDNEAVIMPVMGGRLYPGVRDTLERLSHTHRLFMVSNCTPEGLPNFLRFTGLAPYIEDHISYGENGREKDYNIALMVKRHGLQSPLYIGDTMGDCRASHAAGVPFAWASYGFGRDVAGQDYTLECFSDLEKIVN